MTTSVVIPTWNGMADVTRNLPQVVALDCDEIIVVDDASTDGTPEYINKNFPQIKLITHSQNLRFPKTVNEGVGHASGDLIILLNQDVSPTPDLLKKSLSYFKNPRVFAVTFNEQVHSWAKAGFSEGILQYKNGPLDDHTHYSLWASGAGSVFRKSIWDELGGLDPVFTPGYLEDADLGFRAWKRGYEIIWEPKAIIAHTPESANRRAFKPKYLVIIKERNNILMQWKNLDRGHLFTQLLALKLRIIKHPGFIIPYIMALSHIGHILGFRLTEKSHIKYSDDQIFAKLN